MILMLRYRRLWIAAVAALAAAIATGSLVPAVAIETIGVWDKFQHGGAYFVLTLMLAGIVERRAYPVAAVVALLFGALLEVAQGTLTTTRVTDWHDIVANSTGIAAALVCAYLGLGGWAQRVEARLGIR
jgi:VanZ family protein